MDSKASEKSSTITDKRLNVRILYICVRIIFIYYWRTDALLRLNGLFHVTGIKEAQGARQRNARRNWHQKRRFRVRDCSGTVASTVVRKHEEKTKSGTSCGRINGRMQYCSKFTVAGAVAAGPEFLDHHDPYAARMPGRMTTRKGFL